MSEVKLTGWKELDEELKKLPLKLQTQAIKGMVREGAKVVQRDARARAPKSEATWDGSWGKAYPHKPGNLRRGIIVRRKKVIDKTSVIDQVTIRQGRKHGERDAFYARWVEFGHRLVRKGKVIKQIPPQPFLRPAFDNNQTKVLAVMKVKLLDFLGKYRKG